MKKSEVLQGVRTMRFDEVYGRYSRGVLGCDEAAELLGMSVSSFYRWRKRHESDGASGLADKRLGRVSKRAAPVDEVTRVIELFKTKYWDFTAKHFHEKLGPEHGIRRSYTWTKKVLQSNGCVSKAKSKGAHRKKRARRALPGMMLHQDGSRHEWIAGHTWDLIVTMDDATSDIYSAFFCLEEGTMSTFKGLHEVISAHGLFSSLYADRGSHYWTTIRTGQAGAGKVDKVNLTQVGRALGQLKITLIPAYSPEARGRSERAFGTLQGRLPQELRLAGITTMEAANAWLKEVYIPKHNAQFGIKPAAEGSAFISWIGQNLADTLCIQEERTVGNDNTVRYEGRCLQIPADLHRHHYVKCKVFVHEYPDGHLAIFHGPRCLARYAADSEIIQEQETTQAVA